MMVEGQAECPQNSRRNGERGFAGLSQTVTSAGMTL